MIQEFAQVYRERFLKPTSGVRQSPRVFGTTSLISAVTRLTARVGDMTKTPEKLAYQFQLGPTEAYYGLSDLPSGRNWHDVCDTGE